MKVSPYKRLEKAFKQAYLKPLTLFRYGTLRPERVKLHGSDHWIHIDPADSFARKKAIEAPLRARISHTLAFWRDFNQHLKPDLIVDVGMGYGECLFGTDYETNAVLFGFEANPRLVPFLEKSRAEHASAGNISITNCLVSDTTEDDVPFYVNPEWSGGASALRSDSGESPPLEFPLHARTLDSIIPPDLARGKSLLFKIDVGGYESKALRGFVEILAHAASSIGFAGFDARDIDRAGRSPVEYLGWLQQRFHTYQIADGKEKTLKKVGGFADIPRLHGDPNRVHADLVLVGKQSPDGWLAPAWTILEPNPGPA